jgi:hypothetical protein
LEVNVQLTLSVNGQTQAVTYTGEISEVLSNIFSIHENYTNIELKVTGAYLEPI